MVAVLHLALYPDQRPSDRQAYLALTVRNEATVTSFLTEASTRWSLFSNFNLNLLSAKEFLVIEIAPTIEPKFLLAVPRLAGNAEIGGEQVRVFNLKCLNQSIPKYVCKNYPSVCTNTRAEHDTILTDYLQNLNCRITRLLYAATKIT